jgi:hypothetical protein
VNSRDAAQAEENIPMSKWLVLPIAMLAYVSTVASGAPRRDSAHDGLSNGAEIHRYHTKPHKKDTDRDGLRDGREVGRYHTNPRKKDTDRDGFSDRREIRAGTNPRKRKSHPRKHPRRSPAGFPNASNTGVPAGTALTAYTGPSRISTPGTVIEGKTMGCVRVTAPGVVIRKSKISCGGGYAVLSADGDYGGTPLRIEDSEVDCKMSGGTALGEASITARRLNIHACENGGDINQSFDVQDSYVHDLYQSASAHPDGFQFASGHFENGARKAGSRNVTIKHNTIYATRDDGTIGNAAIISNRGGDTNVLIQGNLLAGGGYTLYCEQDARGSNYRVLDNAFSRRFSHKIGFYGPSTDCSDETQSGNYIYETGRPLRLR